MKEAEERSKHHNRAPEMLKFAEIWKPSILRVGKLPGKMESTCLFLSVMSDAFVKCEEVRLAGYRTIGSLEVMRPKASGRKGVTSEDARAALRACEPEAEGRILSQIAGAPQVLCATHRVDTRA